MFFIKTNNKSLDDRYSWGRGSLQGHPRTFSITVRGSKYSPEISKVRKRLKICGQLFHSSEMFEVFLLTYQRFLEVLFSHSITKTLRFLLKKKRSPGHFSIKTKRLTESSPLLAFDAKAEKSRSLVTAYATLQRRFGYQVWLLPFDQYQCTSRILCREQPLQFFCNSKTANFFK